MTTITSAQIDALHALMTSDTDAFDDLVSQPDLDHGQGFPVLTAAAFVTAVKQHFAGNWSASDVIRFIGQLRARHHAAHADINPSAAEEMILTVLRGHSTPSEHEDGVRAYAQFAVLAEIAGDLRTYELDALIAESQNLANQWLTEH